MSWHLEHAADGTAMASQVDLCLSQAVCCVVRACVKLVCVR